MSNQSLTAKILGSVESARLYLGQTAQVNEAGNITVDKGRKTGPRMMFVVRRDGTPIGFVEKYANTKTERHPYKATVYDNGYVPGESATSAYKSTFLGVTYTSGKAGMQQAVNAVATRTPLKDNYNESRKADVYKREACSVETWFERDRAHVSIECGSNTVAEWWDDEVQDMADSGYFTMGKGKAALERSVLDYAVEMGLISESDRSIRKVHRPTDGTAWWNTPEAKEVGTNAYNAKKAVERGHKLTGNETTKELRRMAMSDPVTEAVTNPDLEAVVAEITRHAQSALAGGFVSVNVSRTLGVPSLHVHVHQKPKSEWSSGIFENGGLKVWIDNDGERPVGRVSVTGDGDAVGGTSGRGATYSVSGASFMSGFKFRKANRVTLDKAVAALKKIITAYAAHGVSEAFIQATGASELRETRPSANRVAANESGNSASLIREKDVLDAYVTAALWSSTDDEGDPLDDNYDFSDIAPKTMQQMSRDVNLFVKYLKRTEDLDLEGWTDEQLGHDLWLTRNGHGAGFWDRRLPSKEQLTRVAKWFGQYDLYVGDDGKIYGSGGNGKTNIPESVGESVSESTTKVRSATSVDDYIPGIVAGYQDDGTIILFHKKDYDNKGNVSGPVVFFAKEQNNSDELFSALHLAWNKGFKMSKSEHAALRAKAVRLAKSLSTAESVNEASMKIKPEHYDELVAALRDVKKSQPNVTPEHYVTNKIGKDHAKRFRWDALYATKIGGMKGSEWLVKTLYPYMNDTHADTALKAAVKTVYGGTNESVNEARDWDYERQGPGLVITAPDGRTCWLQGDEASELEDQLDAAKSQKQINMILDAYDDVCESGRTFVLAKAKGDSDRDVVAGTDKEEAFDNLHLDDEDTEVEYRTVQASDAGAARLMWRKAKSMSEAASVDVNELLEAKRKAKGIYRTGDNGVFFIANKDIDKSKAAKTDAKMAKKYGKDFAGLSAKDKLRRIQSVKMDMARYGKRAAWNESYEKPTYSVYAKRLTASFQYDQKTRLDAGDVVFFQDKALTKPVYYVPQNELPRNASKLPTADEVWKLNWITEASSTESEDDNYMPDGGTEASRSYYYLMHRAKKEGMNSDKPGVYNLVLKISQIFDYDINKGIQFCRHILQLALGDTPLPATVTAILGRGAIPTSVRKITALPQWSIQVGNLTLAKAAAFAVLLLEDMNAHEECRELADALAIVVRRSGSESVDEGLGKFKVQESSNMNIAQRALIEARKKMGGGLDITKEVSEISTGARTLGFLLSDAPQSEKDKIAPGGKSFVSPSNTVAKIESFLGSVEEAQQKLTKAELILMDRKRKRREKRGKGLNATGKQRLAAKRNVKKAQRAMLKGSTQRKLARTKARRAKLRGKD